MPCTTILVGKKASYDGSTLIARNDDSGAGSYTPKRFVKVRADQQPAVYKTALSHLRIELPSDPMGYTAMPNVIKGEGIWGACGINEANVAMTATETITSNERVLGLDPLVRWQDPEEDRLLHFPEEYLTDESGAADDSDCSKEDKPAPGGLGEEDFVILTLPYIHSAREGVERLGALLEKYGTYEMNGIAFSDTDEIWWMETIGGHHWIARRVPDDAYVAMPNQFGMDYFDIEDALGEGADYLCSKDLKEFIDRGHLDLSMGEDAFNPRDAFGSHDDADHVYNTPRAWYIERYLNPGSFVWEGEDADFRPDSDDIPWCLIPEKKITVEDIKYLLGSHFQGTPYDPYGSYGDSLMRGAYRSIGVNRTDFMACLQLRPYMDKAPGIEWIAFGSGVFNAFVPMYTDIDDTPSYLKDTPAEVSTDSLYWNNRLIAALTNAAYGKSLNHIERYRLKVQSEGRRLINIYDEKIAGAPSEQVVRQLCEKANQEIADMARRETAAVLDKVLYEASNIMKNAYARSDA
ncbi:C69 family dipeptidase [Butyrivibrio sp. MC2013]|uniref:C69 family dipeptidase n=1 Tax=Butyrivibrio sp. MC2013 TaxID=1280686 RepID=UPI00040652D4|nr:C69 family dipeptidase [Butyrivibrio sp. MC2013]